jgi:endonuclease-8
LNPASEHDESLWVYGRAGKPCRKCGTPIEMKKMGLEARSTYWCPQCQPGAPGRAGVRSRKSPPAGDSKGQA